MSIQVRAEVNVSCYLPASIIGTFKVDGVSVTAVKVTEGVVHHLRFVPRQKLLPVSIATTAETQTGVCLL